MNNKYVSVWFQRNNATKGLFFFVYFFLSKCLFLQSDFSTSCLFCSWFMNEAHHFFILCSRTCYRKHYSIFSMYCFLGCTNPNVVDVATVSEPFLPLCYSFHPVAHFPVSGPGEQHHSVKKTSECTSETWGNTVIANRIIINRWHLFHKHSLLLQSCSDTSFWLEHDHAVSPCVSFKVTNSFWVTARPETQPQRV